MILYTIKQFGNEEDSDTFRGRKGLKIDTISILHQNF